MKRILTFSVVIISLNAFAQAPNWLWAKGIEASSIYDVNYSIAVDAAGNIFTTGNFYGIVDFDPGPGVYNLTGPGMVVFKLDASGNFLWAKATGGNSMALDASANIYITGSFNGTVDFDPGPGVFNLTGVGNVDTYISKLDSSGNFLWAKAIGAGNYWIQSRSIAADSYGNVCLTGQFTGTVDFDPGAGVFNLSSNDSTCGYDIFILKLSSSGNFVWAKAMLGNWCWGNEGIDIAVDVSGNVYSTGSFVDSVDFDPGSGVFYLVSPTSDMIYISKLDSMGNFIWAKAMRALTGSNCFAWGNSIALDASGNVYTAGQFTYSVDFNPGPANYALTAAGFFVEPDIFISKLDSQGNFIWAKRMGNVYTDVAYAISVDAIGDVYTTGKFTDTVDFDPGIGTFNLIGTADIFVSKLNSSGNFVWAKSMGGLNGDVGQAIACDIESNLYIAGYFAYSSPAINFDSYTLTCAGYSNIFVAKLDTVIIGINETENFHPSIILFPNPFSSTATLTINANNFSEGTIEIKNIFGASVSPPKHFSGNTIQLQRNNLPCGIYFYRITTKENEILNGKFIID